MKNHLSIAAKNDCPTNGRHAIGKRTPILWVLNWLGKPWPSQNMAHLNQPENAGMKWIHGSILCGWNVMSSRMADHKMRGATNSSWKSCWATSYSFLGTIHSCWWNVQLSPLAPFEGERHCVMLPCSCGVPLESGDGPSGKVATESPREMEVHMVKTPISGGFSSKPLFDSRRCILC